MSLTSKQFKELQKQEKYLRTAYYSDYIRTPLLSERQYVFDLFQEMTGRKPGSLSCGSCLLDTYKFIARHYFEYLDKQFKEEKKPRQTQRKQSNKKSISNKSQEVNNE